jgi:hypothetical protein
LSNFDFIEYYKTDKLFGGVFSRDNLPTFIKSKFYIINLNQKHESGSHWVAIINFLPSRCYYFDSFGIDPAKKILIFMRTSKKEMIMSSYRIQALMSIMCGYFCIYIIDSLQAGKKFQDVLLEFDASNYMKNDQLIKMKLNLI